MNKPIVVSLCNKKYLKIKRIDNVHESQNDYDEFK